MANANVMYALAARTYAERYPERYHPPHNYVLRLLQVLSQEGRFPGRQINQQRRRANMFDEDIELQVLAYELTDVHHLGMLLSKLEFHMVMYKNVTKKHKMHPYKIDLVQHLRAGDFTLRLEFIAWFNIQFHNNPLIINHILWSDESKFTNNVIDTGMIQTHTAHVKLIFKRSGELMYGVD
jgi:hypothetical protein